MRSVPLRSHVLTRLFIRFLLLLSLPATTVFVAVAVVGTIARARNLRSPVPISLSNGALASKVVDDTAHNNPGHTGVAGTAPPQPFSQTHTTERV